MLAMVLEEEVNAFLRRDRYERGKEFRGYRNGYHPKREVTVGLGPVEVRVPRVSEVPSQVSPNGFESRIVLKYQRASEATRRLFTRLYLEGLATGDFEPVFREYGMHNVPPVFQEIREKSFHGDENPEEEYHPHADEDPHYWVEGAPLATLLILT